MFVKISKRCNYCGTMNNYRNKKCINCGTKFKPQNKKGFVIVLFIIILITSLMYVMTNKTLHIDREPLSELNSTVFSDITSILELTEQERFENEIEVDTQNLNDMKLVYSYSSFRDGGLPVPDIYETYSKAEKLKLYNTSGRVVDFTLSDRGCALMSVEVEYENGVKKIEDFEFCGIAALSIDKMRTFYQNEYVYFNRPESSLGLISGEIVFLVKPSTSLNLNMKEAEVNRLIIDKFGGTNIKQDNAKKCGLVIKATFDNDVMTLVTNENISIQFKTTKNNVEDFIDKEIYITGVKKNQLLKGYSLWYADVIYLRDVKVN